MPPTAEKYSQLDPATILADDNSRYALLPFHLEVLERSIVEQGGVNTPIEVEPHDDGNGHKYRLTAGFGRLSVVNKLNAEGAGLKIPAIVKAIGDPHARLRRQLSENIDRKSLSPMDMAVAAKRLLDAGTPRTAVLQIFARPGGRKGLTLQPASPSWLNITLAFLELPKNIQDKIHDGRIGVAAAYELGKSAPEKRQAILERAEADRQAEMDAEEKADDKLSKLEAKANEATSKATVAEAELAAATAARTAADALLQAAIEAATEAGKVPGNWAELTEAQRKAVGERLTAAKTDLRGAEKARAAVVKEQEKAQKKYNTVMGIAEEQTEAVTVAKAVKAKATIKNNSKKKPAIGPRDIQKAAAKEAVKAGTESKSVALNASEMRAAVREMSASRFPKTKQLLGLLTACFDGVRTPAETRTDVEVLMGERGKAKA